jgi:hypothetical protein
LFFIYIDKNNFLRADSTQMLSLQYQQLWGKLQMVCLLPHWGWREQHLLSVREVGRGVEAKTRGKYHHLALMD